MAQSHSLGKTGERLAIKYLKDNGLNILEKNWVAGRKEIDIIAEDDEFIIFVEVKTRMADFQLHPRDAVSVPKQRNIIYAAQTYIQRNDIDKEARFDIVTIVVDGPRHELDHIKDAFYPTL
ncbi:MAG TPA: endonuclease [Bacteroidales bacterium]|nr:endonuclease [Bacteroidales bacterium]